jgi:hypothetical protein
MLWVAKEVLSSYEEVMVQVIRWRLKNIKRGKITMLEELLRTSGIWKT